MLSPQKLIELFAQQSSWQDRYRQLILLSKQLPDFPEDRKIATNQVIGCENRVWLTSYKQPDNTVLFQGDSEGRIVKGLLAVLLILVNGKTVDEIRQMDLLAQITNLHISEGLSETRLLGLAKLIERIKSIE
ncbi:cysteine desulfurase sulfur acceptor subunit CsdE [Orbaceae bacterium ESL0727]|nr:cysteine desulfurase sulfur acceptor subunit CsdE [Orbaceae bacterium ESL0727]